MKKEFTIEKSEKDIFRGYVELIRPFLKGLRPREADVFAEILYRYYKKKDVPNKKDRMALVLSSDSREEMVNELNMSHAILRNAISSLRKKSIIKKDNSIPDVYFIDLTDGKILLCFNFVVK